MYHDQQIKVLIVDDDPGVSKTLSRIAIGIGFDTDVAPTASNALQSIASENKPDILILDLRLNGGSGGHSGNVVLDAWLSKRLGPVCVVSGFLTTDIQNGLHIRGADNVIPKPFEAATVQAILNKFGREVLKDRRIESLTKELESLKATVATMSGKMVKYERALRIGTAVLAVLVLTVLGFDGPQIIDKLLSIL